MLSVQPDAGDRFPAPPFTGVVFPSQTIPDFGVDSEEVNVLTVDGDEFTFERGDNPVDITTGMVFAALATQTLYNIEEQVTLSQEFPATDTNVALQLRSPGGAVGRYTSALQEEATDGGSAYSLAFEANESGQWAYAFTSDQRVFGAQDFFVRFSEVY